MGIWRKPVKDPELPKFIPLILYWYGDFPPEPVTVIIPRLLQPVAFDLLTERLSADAGWLMLKLLLTEQLLPISVMTTL